MQDRRQKISSGNPMELLVGYSRAVRVGDQVWVAGTSPQWPDGTVDPDPAVQTRRCLEIIEGALIEAGSDIRDVVRTRIYLVAEDDFPDVARIHATVFGEVRPACTAVIVAGLLDPRWKVEIEVDAISDPVRVRR